MPNENRRIFMFANMYPLFNQVNEDININTLEFTFYRVPGYKTDIISETYRVNVIR